MCILFMTLLLASSERALYPTKTCCYSSDSACQLPRPSAPEFITSAPIDVPFHADAN